MTAADSEAEKKKNILFVCLLLTNPSPTSIQGTLALVLRVSLNEGSAVLKSA